MSLLNPNLDVVAVVRLVVVFPVTGAVDTAVHVSTIRRYPSRFQPSVTFQVQ
jgi:hypothetical protein